MTRIPLDDLTSNQLDQLHDDLDRVREQRHRYHQALQQKTSQAHAQQAALARIRALHHPTGVVAAAEHGNPPDCAVCGDNCWPCPTYQAATEPEPAATESKTAKTAP